MLRTFRESPQNYVSPAREKGRLLSGEPALLMLICTAVFTVLPLMKRFIRDMPQNIL